MAGWAGVEQGTMKVGSGSSWVVRVGQGMVKEGWGQLGSDRA